MSLTPARRAWSPAFGGDGDDYDGGGGGHGSGSGSGKKSRSLNCAECRRLKIKCDRKVPCNGCVKRGYPELCPDRALGGLKGLIKERDELSERVHQLESILAQLSPQQSGYQLQDHAQPAPILPAAHALGAQQHPTDPFRRDSNLLSDITGMDALASAASRSPRVIGPEPTEEIPQNRTNDLGPQSELGTLVVITEGRSSYVGPSAGMQWLRDDMLRGSQGPNMNATGPTDEPEPLNFGLALAQPTDNIFSYSELHRQLPDVEEARRLAQSYFRRVAWIGSPISVVEVELLLDSAYVDRDPQTVDPTDRLVFQDMALVAAILASGTIVNMEIPALDPQAVKYLQLAQSCLIAGKFMVVTSLRVLQALALICNTLPYVDLYHRWDYAWQLWGVAERIMQSMGLHRDGNQWSLDPREVDHRRRVFWYVHTCDVFMSANWDRLTGLSSDHYDTMFPDSWLQPAPTFDYIHGKLACLAKECADATHKVIRQSYGNVVNLWRRICALEDETPFKLRCRAAMKAMVSKYANAGEAENDSPAASAADVTLVFQQHYLVMKTCSTITALLRPYFVTALRDSPSDPTHSPYAAAFLAVVERSSMMVAALQSLYALSPLVSARHWFFWSDGLSAATALGIICIVAPGSSLAPLAMRDFEVVLSLLPNVRESMPREVTRRDIEWIFSLHDKAVQAVENHKLASTSGRTSHQKQSPAQTRYNAERTDAELNMQGWRTRLIKRALPSKSASTSEHQSTTGAGEMDIGSLVEPSWWDGLFPPTAADTTLGGEKNVLPQSSDWLQQILAMNETTDSAQQFNSQTVETDPNFTLDTFWQQHQ